MGLGCWGGGRLGLLLRGVVKRVRERREAYCRAPQGSPALRAGPGPCCEGQRGAEGMRPRTAEEEGGRGGVVPAAARWGPVGRAERRVHSPAGESSGSAGRGRGAQWDPSGDGRGAGAPGEEGGWERGREGDGRGPKVGKEGAGGRAPWPRGRGRRSPTRSSWAAARAEPREEGKAEARGACLGRRGREGGGRRCARGAVCARSPAPGGRWPRRESWGDARSPRRLGGGRRGEPDGAAARQAGGRAVRVPPPQPRRPPPHCRWPRVPRVPAAGGAGGRAGEPG